MDKEKLTETLSDKAFVEKIVKLQTPEEVQTAFKEKGIEISVNDVQTLGSIVNEMVAKGTPKLSEEDLANISGGSLKSKDFIVGFVAPIAAIQHVVPGSDPPDDSYDPSFAAGLLLASGALIATGVALASAVPWAYKKIKGAIT